MTRLRFHRTAALVLLACALTPWAHAVDENEPLSMVFESSPEPGQEVSRGPPRPAASSLSPPPQPVAGLHPTFAA